MQTTSADIASLRETLWANGYRPVPVKTNDKRPIDAEWVQKALQDPPACVGAVVQGVARSTGILCNGLRPIDIDVVVPDLAEKIEALCVDRFGPSPRRGRAGSSKVMLLYRAAEGEPRKAQTGVVEGVGKVEVLGRGNQFVAYGTHPDRTDYTWFDGPSPEDTLIDELRAVSEEQIHEFLCEAAALIGATPPKPREIEADEAATVERQFTGLPSYLSPEARDRDDARRKAYATSAMERVFAEVSRAPKGARSDTINAGAYSLGRLVGGGIMSLNEAEACLLDAVSDYLKDNPTKTKGTIKRAVRAGMSNPFNMPEVGVSDGTDFMMAMPEAEPVRVLAEDGKTIIDQDTGEIIGEVAPPREEMERPTDIPDRLPGVLGDIADWILDTSESPQPMFAIGAALSVVSTVLGRQFLTPSRAGLNLYVLNLVRSGGGKDHPQDCAVALLKTLPRYGSPDAIQLDSANPHVLGQFGSSSALVRRLKDFPVTLAVIDEFSHYMRNLTGRQAGAHNAEIPKLILELFSKAAKAYFTPALKDSGGEEIICPHLGILASSTPNAFFQALTAQATGDGFLNRFLIMRGDDNFNITPATYSPPPKRIELQLQRMYCNGLGLSELSTRFVSAGGSQSFEPDHLKTVAWGPGVKEAFYKLRNDIAGAGSSDETYSNLSVRTAELSLRVATIIALARSFDKPMVTMADLDMGKAIARSSFDCMYSGVRYEVADSNNERVAKRILQVIDKAGGKATRSAVVHQLGSRFTPREREDALRTLLDSGQITSVKEIQTKQSGETSRKSTEFFVITTKSEAA